MRIRVRTTCESTDELGREDLRRMDSLYIKYNEDFR
jgi:hypothetical protein